MAKNARKHRKAEKVAAKKKYHRMAESMEADYVPAEDPLQSDPDFRTEIRQRGGVIEKRGDRFVLVSPPRQPNS